MGRRCNYKLRLHNSLKFSCKQNKKRFEPVSSFTKISFSTAVEQSLGSLTASIFTPNRVGEYAAKCLYYSKEKTKKIIFLNFLGNSTQMIVTIFFGMIGVLFLFILSTLFGDYESFENSSLFWLPIVFIFGLLLFVFKI